MKKTLITVGLGVAIVALGAGAIAWADPGGSTTSSTDPVAAVAGPNKAKRQAVRECLRQAKAANPNATPSQVLDAAKPCLQNAGLTQAQIDKLTKLAAARDCMQQARKDNPDATRTQLLDLAKPCLQAAGVSDARLDRAGKRLECLKQAHADHPDATRAQLRQDVKTCMQAG